MFLKFESDLISEKVKKSDTFKGVIDLLALA